jgi:hypothetical protein
LKYQNCAGSYIGQAGRFFEVRYGEHMQAIRTNSEKMGYSYHILTMGNSYGSLETSLEILNIQGPVSQYTGKVSYLQNKTNRLPT